MTQPLPSPTLPAWVRERDGSLVPFEPDRLSRSLFAATEALGRPDAFLARELADGVLHFLAAELEGETPTTEQVAECAVKVVRELGQPALAQAYADRARQRPPEKEAAAEVVLRFSAREPLAAVVPACVREYALRTVFTRDLIAAQDDGLLTLTGLEAPLEMAGCVLGPAAGGLVEALEEARRLAAGFVAIDGPEHGLTEEAAAGWLRELAIGLRATGLSAVVNLNVATPPPWADDLADGPLFAGQRRPPAEGRLAALADLLLDRLPTLPVGPGTVRIDWHLGERDFRSEAEGRLLRLARRAAEGAALAFVFDRPRRPVALAEGIDRQHPAVLLTVGLNLPRLVEQAARRSGLHLAGKGPADAEVFLHKLGSLARLAISAAAQKRDFLRGQGGPPAARGFLLDRARLVASPIGLEDVVRSLTGHGLCDGGPALDLARQVVRRLRDVLHQEGRSRLLETCVDGPADLAPGGLTAWDAAAAPKAQLKAAGVLHAAAEGGTAALLLPEGPPPTAEQAAGWLRLAWRQGNVVRLRLARAAAAHRQLSFGPA
ncbi:MAG TPA: ATP cone domain-containing protein [Gemmataceae bacterium]|nr:ATP cone domain-containing protein [Gemmataceae bacterium]